MHAEQGARVQTWETKHFGIDRPLGVQSHAKWTSRRLSDLLPRGQSSVPHPHDGQDDDAISRPPPLTIISSGAETPVQMQRDDFPQRKRTVVAPLSLAGPSAFPILDEPGEG